MTNLSREIGRFLGGRGKKRQSDRQTDRQIGKMGWMRLFFSGFVL